MKQELVRINSIDGLELPGILYTPNQESNKIVLHVHGMSGNFYENKFIDILAKTYTSHGYAFLTFNNRGKDYITEILSKGTSKILGSCYEVFEDCILDIQGVVNWIKNKGYTEITLEGHSFGCNKVVYYYNNTTDEKIKNIILLSPCDIPKEVEINCGDKYESIVKTAKELVEMDKGTELIDFPVFINNKISAKTFCNNLMYNSVCDFFRYRENDNKNSILNNLNIPITIIFGDKDNYVLTQKEEIIKEYFDKNIKNSIVKIIKNADHCYKNSTEELGKIVEENILQLVEK